MSNYFSFDGTGGYVLVPGYQGVAGPFDERHPRAVSFWIRTTQSGSWGTVCYWGATLTGTVIDNGEQNRIRLHSNTLELFGRGSSVQTAIPINDGNWHHVVFNYNPDTSTPAVRNFAEATVYVDTVESKGKVRDDGINFINTPGEQDVVIGARPHFISGVTDLFQGDLDEFAVYRDALTTATVAASYNGGVRGANLVSLNQGTSLQLWYRMGDDPGDTVPSGVLSSGTLIDQSNFGRHGVTFSGISIGT